MATKIKYSQNNNEIFDYLDAKAVGIVISNLNKSFGDNYVLRDLCIEIKSEETLVILGESGSGKTVLLKHIAGLLPPDSGEIYIDGIEINSENKAKNYKLAMVFQSSALFNSLTVKENLALYLREHKITDDEDVISSIVTSCLDIVSLKGKEQISPSDLSGGMKKRVAVARALVMNPDIILFDEPTEGLDPMMRDTISDLINELKNIIHVTQIVVTHNVDFAAKIADRIAILYEGKIYKLSTYEEMKFTSDPIIKQFFS